MKRNQTRKIYKKALQDKENESLNDILEDIKIHAKSAQHPYEVKSKCTHSGAYDGIYEGNDELYYEGTRIHKVHFYGTDFELNPHFRLVKQNLPKLKKLGYTCKILGSSIGLKEYKVKEEYKYVPIFYIFRKKIKVINVTTEKKLEPCEKIVIEFD